MHIYFGIINPEYGDKISAIKHDVYFAQELQAVQVFLVVDNIRKMRLFWMFSSKRSSLSLFSAIF